MRLRLLFLLALTTTLLTNNLLSQTVFGGANIVIDDSKKLTQPFTVVDVDLDSDGDLDILTVANKGGVIAWFENENGTFLDISIVDNVFNVTSVISFDLDNDMDNDIVICQRQANTVTWYENLGGGTFSVQQTIATNVDEPSRIFSEDVDNDGNSDIIIEASTYDGYGIISWIRNLGNTNFAQEAIVDTGNYFDNATMIPSDLDNDGDYDIICARQGAGQNGAITWYEFQANGNFSAKNVIADNLRSAWSVGTGDLDGDNKNDIITIYQNESYEFSIVWYKNLGNGNFDEAQIVDEELGYVFANMTTNDIDDDGDVDIFAGIDDSKAVIYINNGNGSNFTKNIIESGLTSATEIIVTDIQGDGNKDIVMCSYYEDRILLLEQDGSGIFSNQSLISYGADGVKSVFASDIDNDGDIDILSASTSDGNIQSFVNNGQNIFGLPIMIEGDYYKASHVYTNDFDDDGDNDIFTNSQDVAARWYENLGDGTLTESQNIETGINNISYSIVVDLDNDGRKDVLGVSQDKKTLGWFRNVATDSFSLQITIANTSTASNVVDAADLDNDGDMDIVIGVSSYTEPLLWFENLGSGNFSSENILDLSCDPLLSGQVYSLVIEDIDNNGTMDIIAGNFNNGRIIILRNDGLANFSCPLESPTGASGIRSVKASDLDNDGDIEVIITSSSGDRIGYYDNLGNNEFSALKTIANELDNPSSVFVTDIDSDGDNDILAGSGGDSKITWYENLLGESTMEIQGRVYWDKNVDTIFNNNDEIFKGVALLLEPEGTTFYTDVNGMFSLITSNIGSHEINIEYPVGEECNEIVSFDLLAPNQIPYQFQYQPFETLVQDFVFRGNEADCRTVSGLIYNDLNQNGIQDNGENGLKGILLMTTNNGNVFSGNNGEYSLSLLNSLNDEISPSLTNNNSNGYCSALEANYLQTFPLNNESHIITANSGNIQGLDFGLFIEAESEIEVGIYSLNVYQGNQAGKDFYAWMDFKASSPITEACTLRIDHDPLLTLLESDLPVTNTGDDFVEWVFEAGTAPDFYCMHMDWYLDSSAITGNVLHWEATYGCPPSVDGCPQNNTIKREVQVISGPLRITSEYVQLYSMCPEGEMPEIISKDEVLSYEIIFQNPLGTTAYDVLIVDTLPEELNIESISLPFSSFNDYDFRTTEEGIVIIQLSGINLSVAEVNEINSYGFVQFNITLKEGLANGTIIPNKATVFFNGISKSSTNEVIHVVDSQVPIALCQPNLEIYLDDNGQGFISAEMLDNGSSDNDNIAILEIDIETFNCSQVGMNSVLLTVTDESQNSSTCTTIVEVIDNILPQITCEDISLVFQEGESEELEVDDVVTMIEDNCGMQSVVFNQSSFSVDDEGDNSITLTATDINGNINTCILNVNVTIVTNILENHYGIFISIAPNPLEANTIVKFSQSLPFNYDLKIFDISGKEMRQYNNQSESFVIIERASLLSGMYIIHIYERGNIEVLGSYKLIVK